MANVNSRVSGGLVGAVCIVLIAASALYVYRSIFDGHSAVGKEAPDFRLPERGGGSIRLSELRGKPVLIVWWAIDCSHCRLELPHLEALARKYRNRGLVVLAVNAWNEPHRHVDEFIERSGISAMRVLYDGAGVKRAFAVDGIPASTLLDARGRVVLHPDAYDSERPGELEAILDKLLQE